MHEDFIRREFAAIVADARRHRGAERLLSGCWPGGGDRTEPVALNWLRRWRPARSATPLPQCSCRAGHCAVCN